jgi:hypothetical protein
MALMLLLFALALVAGGVLAVARRAVTAGVAFFAVGLLAVGGGALDVLA